MKNTKMSIAIAFMEFLDKGKPMNKITINDIAEQCHINRMTFYYHFEDIYDLLNWMLINHLIIKYEPKESFDNLGEEIKILLHKTAENKNIISNIITHGGREHLEAFAKKQIGDLFKTVLDDMTQEIKISEENKSLIVYIYRTSFSALFTDWIKSGMKNTPDTVIRRFERLIRGTMRQCIENVKEN